jgi:hypothetical protein
MKLALTVLSLLAIMTSCVSAQTVASTTTNGEIIDALPIQVGVAASPDGTFYTTRERGSVVMIIFGEYVVRNGVPGYELNPDSIRFRGDDEFINRIPTDKVYEFLSREIVAQGTLRGFTPSSPDCSVPTRTKVYSKACVTRDWRGINTRFIPCTDQNSIWEYAVCRADGSEYPNVTRVPYENPVICPIGEPTCPTVQSTLLR